MNWKEKFQCLKQQERSSKNIWSQSAVAGKDHISGTPGKLLKAAGYGGILIVAVGCRYLRRNRKEIFRLRASQITYWLPFDAYCPELLINSLPYGTVRQFLLAFLKRCVHCNAPRHIIYAVYAKPLFQVPNFCFEVGRGKKDLCLAALEDVYGDIASVTQRNIFGRTLHFVELFALVFLKFRVYFSLIRPCLPDIQPVCIAFKGFFFAFSLSCSAIFWFGGKSAILR